MHQRELRFITALTSSKTLEDLREALGAGSPYWMSPFELCGIELALIGSPENSKEWRADSAGHTQRAKLPMGVTYQDYTNVGWPSSAGSPVRKVTRWEHQEILRRLKFGGLTKPGAEVQTVGKTLAEMIEDGEMLPDWIIDGVLREGGSAMIYGPSGRR